MLLFPAPAQVTLDRIADPRSSAWWSVEGKVVGAFPDGKLEERIPAWASHIMVPELRLLRFSFCPALRNDARVVAQIDDSARSSMSFLSIGSGGVNSAYVLAPSSSAPAVTVRVGVSNTARTCILEQPLPGGHPRYVEKVRVQIEVDPVSVPNYIVPAGRKSNLILLRVPVSLRDRYYSVALIDRSGKLHELSGAQYPLPGLDAVYQYEQFEMPVLKSFYSCVFPIGRLDRKAMVKVKVFASPFRWLTFWSVANARTIRSEP
jgi:hypothetical protein